MTDIKNMNKNKYIPKEINSNFHNSYREMQNNRKIAIDNDSDSERSISESLSESPSESLSDSESYSRRPIRNGNKRRILIKKRDKVE